LANGGLLSSPGSITCSQAAKAHSTPVVVLSGVYKICPDWTWIGGDLNATMDGNGMNPGEVLAFDEEGRDDGDGDGELEIVNPNLDYIPPELVDVFITNVGEHPPSYVYRLIKENYAEQDLGEL